MIIGLAIARQDFYARSSVLGESCILKQYTTHPLLGAR